MPMPLNKPRNDRIQEMYSASLTWEQIADQLPIEGFLGPDGEPIKRQRVGQIIKDQLKREENAAL